MATSATSDQLRKAFDYLRGEAVDAHLAGDGMRVLHLCTIALEQLRHAQGRANHVLNVADIRWALFFNLYWMLDDWMRYSIDDSFKRLSTDDVSAWDRKLVEFLLTTLHIPLNFDAIDELKDAPASWLALRSQAVEDLAALTLAIELTWYKDCQSSDWKDLADAWLSDCPNPSPLHTEIQQVIERLALQSVFCVSGTLPDKNKLPAGTTSEQAALVDAWRLYHEARVDELDFLIRQLAGRIRLESPMYPALFRVMHFSRISRSSKESQFLSLSRLRYVESRQPAQACQQLRDERFESNFAQIAREGFPDGAATERFTCFRMAMLNQLHSLRSWDMGGWLLGERQRGQALLELGARGDIRFVKPGILALRNSLGVPERGKYPHFDRSIELLDALPEEQRRAITRELIASPRIAWPNAHRVLSELSDAIPSDVLAEVARWNVRLDLDAYHGRWTRTWLSGWDNLLGWSDDAPELIELLKPALLAKAADHACWDKLHGTLCASIIRGHSTTAHAILTVLTGVVCDDTHFNQSRYSILHNAVRHRPELAEPAKEWLKSYVERKQDQFQLFAFRHIDSPAETDIDDDIFRDWVRSRVLENCEKRLEERGSTVTFGLIDYHAMMFQLTWPRAERDLIQRLISVVEADYVPFTNKSDPIACLAMLALRCPVGDSSEIANAALRWIDHGIIGRDLGHTGPLSTGQMRGLGPEAITPAFAFLLDALAERHFNIVGERLTKWVIAEGIRRPTTVVDHTLRTAFFCSIALRSADQPLAVALIGIAEGAANTAFLLEPGKTIDGFSGVVLDPAGASAVSEWRSSSAGKLCLELWQRRLVEASLLARPRAREAAATAIRRWEKAAIELPQVLQDTHNRLASDCRLRVRAAISA